jgi:hypothetical protein
VSEVGLAGTGTYGAEPARHLAEPGLDWSSTGPTARAAVGPGKSDPIGALAAAVLAGRATGAPTTRTGPVEDQRRSTSTRASATGSSGVPDVARQRLGAARSRRDEHRP